MGASTSQTDGRYLRCPRDQMGLTTSFWLPDRLLETAEVVDMCHERLRPSCPRTRPPYALRVGRSAGLGADVFISTMHSEPIHRGSRVRPNLRSVSDICIFQFLLRL